MILMIDKPYSPACDRNKEPILEVLKEVVAPFNKNLLEIGSGTGQHAVFFAPHFKHLTWVTSDLEINHQGIKMWLSEFKISNIIGPIEFEIGKTPFPKQTKRSNHRINTFDLIFTANTFHIMSWKECKTLLKMWGNTLHEGYQVLIYGPFNYEG